ncbi:hypothetical protein [Vulcanisaeta thermophila]|uniref:hypothetical protein n=1 Tax=Vulcanisaeta thermophila TaxID=867917 RepID=UPI00085390CD|nr:hypothetical protein [Vulcanisaeta thermophila]
MGNGDYARRVRRGIALGIALTVLFFIMGLTHVGEAYALEPRVYGYVIYSNEAIEHVNYLPTYLYFWRVSTLLFLAWLIAYVAYAIKPAVTLDSSGIVYGIFYVVTHYIYLLTMGVPITIYPFIYTVKTVGSPLPYLDWGQVVLLITIWRIYSVRKSLRGRK